MRIVVLLALLCVALPAGAADRAQVQSDCAPDAFRFCSALILPVYKGEKAMIDCMKRHKSKLSPACAAHLKEKP